MLTVHMRTYAKQRPAHRDWFAGRRTRRRRRTHRCSTIRWPAAQTVPRWWAPCNRSAQSETESNAESNERGWALHTCQARELALAYTVRRSPAARTVWTVLVSATPMAPHASAPAASCIRNTAPSRHQHSPSYDPAIYASATSTSNLDEAQLGDHRVHQGRDAQRKAVARVDGSQGQGRQRCCCRRRHCGEI